MLSHNLQLSDEKLSAALTTNTTRHTFTIVDTGQTACYDSDKEITPPKTGEEYYGQDAQYPGYQPAYTLSSDGLTYMIQ